MKRSLLVLMLFLIVLSLLAASCVVPTPEVRTVVVKETLEVTKEVTKEITKEVTKEVTKEITKEVTKEVTKVVPVTVEKPVKLVFWHTQQPDAFRGKLLNEMIADFQKQYPWITIESVYQGEYTDLYKKIMAAIAAGNWPDLSVSYPSMISEYMKAGAVIPLDSFIYSTDIGLTKQDMEDIFPGYLAECRFPEYGNQYLAFPFTKSFLGMFYNLSLLKQAGYNAAPKTWKEFEEMCLAVTQKTKAKGYAYYESASTFDGWLFSRGAEQLTPDQTKAIFNGPEAIESLEMLNRLIAKGAAWKPEGSYADQAEFGKGNVAFTMSSTSGLPYYAKAIKDAGNEGKFEWGQTNIPQADPKKPSTVMYGASICVFRTTSEKQKAAWLFIKWFSDTKQTAKWGTQSGYMPVRRSAAALLDEYFKKERGAKEQWETIVPYGKPEPSVRGEQEIRAYIEDAIVAATTGVKTPKQALDDAVKKSDDALERGRK